MNIERIKPTSVFTIPLFLKFKNTKHITRMFHFEKLINVYFIWDLKKLK